MTLRASHKLEHTGSAVMLQNDNTAAVDALNRGRAKNAPFATILKAVPYSAAMAGDVYVAAHLQVKANAIAYNLSRGNVELAQAESKRKFNRAIMVQLPESANLIMGALKGACEDAERAVARPKANERRSQVEKAKRRGRANAEE